MSHKRLLSLMGSFLILGQNRGSELCLWTGSSCLGFQSETGCFPALLGDGRDWTGTCMQNWCNMADLQPSPPAMCMPEVMVLVPSTEKSALILLLLQLPILSHSSGWALGSQTGSSGVSEPSQCYWSTSWAQRKAWRTHHFLQTSCWWALLLLASVCLWAASLYKKHFYSASLTFRTAFFKKGTAIKI